MFLSIWQAIFFFFFIFFYWSLEIIYLAVSMWTRVTVHVLILIFLWTIAEIVYNKIEFELLKLVMLLCVCINFEHEYTHLKHPNFYHVLTM